MTGQSSQKCRKWGRKKSSRSRSSSFFLFREMWNATVRKFRTQIGIEIIFLFWIGKDDLFSGFEMIFPIPRDTFREALKIATKKKKKESCDNPWFILFLRGPSPILFGNNTKSQNLNSKSCFNDRKLVFGNKTFCLKAESDKWEPSHCLSKWVNSFLFPSIHFFDQDRKFREYREFERKAAISDRQIMNNDASLPRSISKRKLLCLRGRLKCQRYSKHPVIASRN